MSNFTILVLIRILIRLILIPRGFSLDPSNNLNSGRPKLFGGGVGYTLRRVEHCVYRYICIGFRFRG